MEKELKIETARRKQLEQDHVKFVQLKNKLYNGQID